MIINKRGDLIFECTVLTFIVSLKFLRQLGYRRLEVSIYSNLVPSPSRKIHMNICRQIQSERNKSGSLKNLLFHIPVPNGEDLNSSPAADPSHNLHYLQILTSDPDFLLLNEILYELEVLENKYLRLDLHPSSSMEGKKNISITRLVIWIKFKFYGKAHIEAILQELRSHNKHLQKRFHRQLDLQNQQLIIQALQETRTGTRAASEISSRFPTTDIHTLSSNVRPSHSTTGVESEQIVGAAPMIIDNGLGAATGDSIFHSIGDTVRTHDNSDTPAISSRIRSIPLYTVRVTPADGYTGSSQIRSVKSSLSEERWDNCSNSLKSHVRN